MPALPLRSVGTLVVLMALAPACSAAHARRTSAATRSYSTDQALRELQSELGPERFALVTPHLYRGGAPSERNLHALHALGVTTVVDLRRERLDSRHAERAIARELGIRYVEFPFYGVFGVRTEFLHQLVDELRADHDGAVYVHCDHGRDRTSLAVALYRVFEQGWDPDLAWGREAIAFGHSNAALFREIELAFRETVLEAHLRSRTMIAGPGRTRAVAARTGVGDTELATVDLDVAASGATGAAVEDGQQGPFGALVQPAHHMLPPAVQPHR